MKGLKDNLHILDAITNELLQNSRITGLVRCYFCLRIKLLISCKKICIEISTIVLFFQEVEERMKGLSPVMFEDFVKPYQINLEEVDFFAMISLFKS